MIILAVDTSGPVCGTALTRDGLVLSEHYVQNKLTHSVNLLPMIDGTLRESGVELRQVDRIACVVGPGSFTGVRIGVSTVKGLAHGAGIPCVPVNALEAMAAGAGAFQGIICPIQDARAGQVYGAAFRAGTLPERLMEDKPVVLEEYLKAVSTWGEPCLFLGDGMPVHRKRIAEFLGDQAVFAPSMLASLRPSAAAYLGEAADKTVDYLQLMPLYLRAPSAERNRKLVEAAKAAHE